MAEQPQSMERRMVHRLLRHWRAAQWEDRMPSLEDVYKQRLGDIVPQSFVLRIGADEPVFGRIGEAYTDVNAAELKGQPISAAPSDSLLHHAAALSAQVLERKVPMTVGDSYVDRNGRRVLYRSIVLPTSDDGVTISFLLAAANSKIVDDDHGQT